MSTIAAPTGATTHPGDRAPSGATATGAPPGRRRVHSTWKSSMIVALAAAAVVSIVLLAFAWPSYGSKVQNLPVAVAGSDQAASQISKRLTDSGSFTVERAGDRDEIVRRIRERNDYGGIVVSRNRIEVLSASAASPVASQALNGVAQGIAAQSAKAAESGKGGAAQQVVVTDVVPLSKDDPRGAVLGIAALPMAMGGMIGGVLISMLVVGHWRRAAAIAVYGIVAGFVLALILDPWFGALQGHFALEWLALGLAMIATAAVIVGLHGLIGPPGIGIGAVITMFIGNPLSSASAPPEFLPWDWGTIGQCFVPGAGAALLRDISYFPDAGTARYWWALALWACLGFGLLMFGQFRDQQVFRNTFGTEDDAVRPRRAVSSDEPAQAAWNEDERDAGAHRGVESAGHDVRRDAVSTEAPATAAMPMAAPASAGPQLWGTVTASGGRPVPSATVTLADESGRQVGRTTSGSDGTYRLAVPGGGTGLLIVTAPSLAPLAERVSVGGALHHDVALAGRAGLFGRVRRPDGVGREMGVSGAVLTVTDAGGQVVASATTGADGSFAIRGLSGGTHVLTAQDGADLDVRSIEVPEAGEVGCDPVLHGTAGDGFLRA